MTFLATLRHTLYYFSTFRNLVIAEKTPKAIIFKVCEPGSLER